jgi:hypothetical protein
MARKKKKKDKRTKSVVSGEKPNPLYKPKKKKPITTIYDPAPGKTLEDAKEAHRKFEEDVRTGKIKLEKFGRQSYRGSRGYNTGSSSDNNYDPKKGNKYFNFGKKGKQAVNHILPIFGKDKPSELVNEILREDEQIRRYVIQNPKYREFLEQKVLDNFKKYKGVLKGARMVDSWDRVTSTLGLAADAVGPFSAGLGTALSAGEEVVELIPKSIYAVYYGAKTRDLKGMLKFGAAEIASFIPVVGDFIDMSNIYVNRARKITKERSKKDFRKLVKADIKLEQRVQAA